MNKITLGNINKIMFYLSFPFFLTSCGKKAECDYPNYHAHLYRKDFNQTGINDQEIVIEKYLISEDINNWDYVRTEDLMEITSDDAKVIKLLSNTYRINETNWPYLYDLMASVHDYLEFYYEYEIIEIYYETDEDGNSVPKTKKRTESGWTTNPRNSDNTGKVRLVHHQFFALKIVNKDGKLQKEKSPLVDDIRSVMHEYDYIYEDTKCITKVYKYMTVPISKLTKLDAYDPTFNTFKQPDLSNTSMEYGRTR